MNATKIASQRVGSNLKRLIKEGGITQESFANEVLGCDPRVLRRWIHDGVNQIDTINWLAEALEVDVRDLLF